MKLFGLTGGVGMGKSTAAGFLRDRGVAIADTDVIAHSLVEPGRPALAEIKSAFGPDILDGNGRLRRNELARLVFADDTARRRLEAVLHPPIRDEWERQVKAWRAEGRARAAVIIPLLYETDAAPLFDAIICVACTAASQHERLRARGWDNLQIEQRIKAQWPIGKKLELADFVIWTEGDMASQQQQLSRIFD